MSAFTKAELLERLSCEEAEKIRVVHDPVSPVFVNSGKPFNSARPVILQIGTNWNKNLERVAEALNGLNCHLLIVGHLDQGQRELLRSKGISHESYEQITDERMLEMYKACDILVFASLYEGFGLPIVEAQAVGRPVITSDRCSMPEVAGGAACLVQPERSDAIREGILRIVHDAAYRGSLVKRGLENVHRFQASLIANEYAQLYRRTITCPLAAPALTANTEEADG